LPVRFAAAADTPAPAARSSLAELEKVATAEAASKNYRRFPKLT